MYTLWDLSTIHMGSIHDDTCSTWDMSAMGCVHRVIWLPQNVFTIGCVHHSTCSVWNVFTAGCVHCGTFPEGRVHCEMCRDTNNIVFHEAFYRASLCIRLLSSSIVDTAYNYYVRTCMHTHLW